ncbi:MAG: response regulator transcription factor [Acidobacteriota bacterium]
MSGHRILLIEDEPGLVLTLGDRLRSEGFQVESEVDGIRGLEQAARGAYDLLILDLMLPGKGGFDVCRELRQRGVPTPILMLTARDRLVDKVLGLKLGADDYLTKPFEPDELVARCEAILRRTAEQPRPIERFRLAHIRVDLRRAEVDRGGEILPLAGKELDLLSYLAEHRDEAVSRHELLDRIWGYAANVSSRTVDVHVVALRKKIEPDPKRPRFLKTVHGVGYKLLCDVG